MIVPARATQSPQLSFDGGLLFFHAIVDGLGVMVS
jgi:hypothetical protein